MCITKVSLNLRIYTCEHQESCEKKDTFKKKMKLYAWFYQGYFLFNITNTYVMLTLYMLPFGAFHKC